LGFLRHSPSLHRRLPRWVGCCLTIANQLQAT
jgi:hypothetical protein